jgi:hypothetical protein
MGHDIVISLARRKPHRDRPGAGGNAGISTAPTVRPEPNND